MIFDWRGANANEIENKPKNFDVKHKFNVNEDWNDFSGYFQEHALMGVCQKKTEKV